MILNTYSEYAVKIVLYLLERDQDGTWYRNKVIAEDLGLSYSLVAKVAHALIQNGILSSLKGPRGGVRMAVQAHELTIRDIIRHFMKLEEFNQCLLGPNECDFNDPCAIHEEWLQTRKHVLSLISKPLSELRGLKPAEIPWLKRKATNQG